MNTVVALRFGWTVAGSAVTLFYLVGYFAMLAYARAHGGLPALGVLTRRWLMAAAAGAIIGGVGVLGTMKLFPQGGFVVPDWRRLTVLMATGLSVGFIESLVSCGHFQFRFEEAFGPVVAIFATAMAWTLFHAVVPLTPGAGTYAAGPLGAGTFLANLFVTFAVIASIVHFTGNIWSSVVQNAVVGNVLINVYMLSVMPQKVLIADPKSLPVALLMAVLVVLGVIRAA